MAEKPQPVQGAYVEKFQLLLHPGAFTYQRNHAGVIYLMAACCPGCGRQGGMQLYHKGIAKPNQGESWEWDENIEEPTLKPSVNCEGCCGWHGYLRKGVWEHV